MPAATQDNRVGKLATPLGKDKLLLTRFEGVEGMGELFEFRVEALSTDANIDFNPALGLNSSVHLTTHDGAGRDFSGVLTQARSLGKRGDFHAYSLVLRPWLWLLSLTSDCKIFPNMDVKQIIKQVFEDRKFSDILDLTAQDYPILEYTVQYRESDLNFVLRLMEECGIYYYFKFEAGDGTSPSVHYLVLADSTSHVPLDDPAEVIFLPANVEARRDAQQFNEWTKSSTMVTGIFAVNDYNYEKPSARQLASGQTAFQFAHGDMEIYNYPGGYDNQDDGLKLAIVAEDAEAARYRRWSASGYAPSLTPGLTIKRTSTIPGDSENGVYLLLRCSHAYGYQSYQAESNNVAETYVGSYELSLSSITFRMPPHTRKPVIAGSQSGLVVGKDKEEIDVDSEGRILVQFYWNRDGSYPGRGKPQSRRVRVGQAWAGDQRGTLFLPRIGDEVMVQYEEGDPDRPIVVGSVYNGTNKVPADLPAKQILSGILTRSSKGGNGYNMLSFNDTAGSEAIRMRSQKDLMFKALANEQRDIGGSQTENIGGDETITVGGPKGGGNFTLNAFKTATINVGPNGSPLTQIVMDNSSITLNVGPNGAACQIVMNMTGITLSVGPAGTVSKIMMGPTGVATSATPVSQFMVTPAGILTAPSTPLMTLAAAGPVTFVTPSVVIPVAVIGAGTVGPLPLL
jgi:type VI secretion system secreted protein VgrG